MSQYEVDCISSSIYILISCWIPAPDLVEDKLRVNDKGEEWKAENYLRFAEKVFLSSRLDPGSRFKNRLRTSFEAFPLDSRLSGNDNFLQIQRQVLTDEKSFLESGS